MGEPLGNGKPSFLDKVVELYKGVRVCADILGVALLISGAITVFYSKNDTKSVVIIVSLAGALIVSLVVFIVVIIRHKKKLKEKEDQFNEDKTAFRRALNSELNDTISTLHTAFEDLREIENDENIRHYLEKFCSLVNSLFKNKRQKHYHVCIKLIQSDESTGQATVVTLVRDGLDNKDRGQIDKQKQIRHFIKHNTDFNHVCESWDKKNGRVFSCNCLPLLDGYMNTSFLPINGNDIHMYKYDNDSDKNKRLEEWPLEYRSCIVSGIGPTKIYDDADGEKTGIVVGFLCVDCISTDGFDLEIDPSIVGLCPQELFYPLQQHIKSRSTTHT